MSLSVLLDGSENENSAQDSRYRHITVSCHNDVLCFYVTSKIYFAAFWLLTSIELILIKKHLRPDSSESIVLQYKDYFACFPRLYINLPWISFCRFVAGPCTHCPKSLHQQQSCLFYGSPSCMLLMNVLSSTKPRETSLGASSSWENSHFAFILCSCFLTTQPRIFSLKHSCLVPFKSSQWRIFQMPLETQGKHINQLLIHMLLVLLMNSSTMQHNCEVQLLPAKAIFAPSKEIMYLCVC